LEAASCHAVHVTGLLHGERSGQLLPFYAQVCTLKNSPAVLKRSRQFCAHGKAA
jgi:hypothetical protein